MEEIKKVEYEGKDEKNNYCFSDGVTEYKYSRKQIKMISERSYFPDDIIYELIIENGITIKINSIEEKIKVKTTSKLIKKIELREKIKRHLKLGDNISELLEKLAELQGENETIKFVEEIKMENKKVITKVVKTEKKNIGTRENNGKQTGLKNKISFFKIIDISLLIFFIGLLAYIIYGGSTTPKINDSYYHERNAVRFLKKNLKNPDSYKEYSVSSIKEKDGVFYIKINYGAQNSFGGMNRKTIIIETKTTDARNYTKKIIGSSE